MIQNLKILLKKKLQIKSFDSVNNNEKIKRLYTMPNQQQKKKLFQIF